MRRAGVPELLAPAGGPDAFLAATAAGADAVYVGLRRYSARAAATGFTMGELERACCLAHARGMRVYVAMNVLLREGEVAGAVAAALEALAVGADALIVTDMGLIAALRAACPGAELHLSTQAGAHSHAAALLAARELGVSRVTCGRELSVAEISQMGRAGVEIEAFVHGAICICYAGSCAFSALRRGRSANRGDCTQPCRASYALVDGEGRVLAGDPALAGGVGCGSDAGCRPVAPAGRHRAAGSGDKLLCPRDHLGIRHVAGLVRAGAAALKIEGRMKRPDYVYNVVGCYRAALDAVAAGEPLAGERLQQVEDRLARSFNRGFTSAYLDGARPDAALMSWERSCNQGLLVGRVVRRGRLEVDVALMRPVFAGDTLEIRSAPGEDAPADVPERWPMVPCPESAPAGSVITVRCKRKVEVGSAVHATRSARLVEEARAAVEGLRAEAGFPRREEEGPDPRSGRRRAGEAAAGATIEASHGATMPAPAPAGAAVFGEGRPDAVVLPAARFVALAETPEEAAALIDRGESERAAVHAWRLLDDLASWRPLLPRLTVILDEVMHDDEEAWVREVCVSARSVVCRNLGQIEVARELAAPFEVAAPVSAWNADAVRELARLGARRVWLPDELSTAELSAVARAVAGRVPLGARLTGACELMVCEHCVLTSEGPCDGVCRSCPRRAGERFLVGADGARLPVRVDARGRSRIFDAFPRDLTDELLALSAAGIEAFLVDAPAARAPIRLVHAMRAQLG